MAKLDDDVRTYWGVQTFCLLTLTLIALGGTLYLLRPVLVPFVLAVFLANCLAPVIESQQRYLHAPRSVAILSTVVVALLAVTLCGSFVATSVGSALDRLGAYEQQFKDFTKATAQRLPLERLGLKADPEELARFFAVQEGTGWQFISAVLGGATSVVSSGVIVLVFMLFLMAGKAKHPRHSGMLGEIERSVERYVVTIVLLSLATGLLVALTLAILGVELAWVFGFLTFLLNFVPTVGAIIASLLPLPVILFSPDLPLAAKILAIAIPATIQFVIGSFVQPRVQGNALDLHPVIVLLALMFFGLIWGITGAFLAAPITGVVRIVCARIPVMQPVAAVLAGDLTVFSGQERGPGQERGRQA
jgi:AI-2 transport protein TqsA